MGPSKVISTHLPYNVVQVLGIRMWTFWGLPFNPLPLVKKKLLTVVKMVRKTLFRTAVLGIKTNAVEERDQAPL